MVGIDPEKLFVLFVIALVVLGPERLPQAARALGRGMAHLRRYSALVRAEVDDVLAEPRAIIHSAAREVEMEQGPQRLRDSPSLGGGRVEDVPLRQNVPRGQDGPLEVDGSAGGLAGQLCAPDDPLLN